MNLSVKNYSVSKITPNIFLSWKPAPCDVIGGGGTDTAHTQTGFGSVLTETASFLSPSKHVEDPTKPECCQISFQYFMYSASASFLHSWQTHSGNTQHHPAAQDGNCTASKLLSRLLKSVFPGARPERDLLQEAGGEKCLVHDSHTV